MREGTVLSVPVPAAQRYSGPGAQRAGWGPSLVLPELDGTQSGRPERGVGGGPPGWVSHRARGP